MTRTIFAAGALIASCFAGLAKADDCCSELAAYNGEAGSQNCSQGVDTWTCPAVRAHYPVQRWCNSTGPMKCVQKRNPVPIPVFRVNCGTAQNRCPDGANTGRTVPADNDLCNGTCGTKAPGRERKDAEEKFRGKQAKELERVERTVSREPSREH